MAIDTACSSSLVATNLAFEFIKGGSTAKGVQGPDDNRGGGGGGGGALVGGVNMMLLGGTTAMFQAAGMLSPDGRCKTLDASADGYVRAEACSMALLLPASNPSDCIALLVGTAVNQDGRSSSLTAPNGPAQQRVMREALGPQPSAAMDAVQVGYMS